MKVRRRAKTAVPPGVIERIGQDPFEARGGHISGHLVTDQANLSEQKRRDMRIRRIVKRRHEESRPIRSLLMNVVHDFRKPFFPQQASDRFGLFQIEHEPVAIVVVTGIVMVKLGRLATFSRRAEGFPVPVGNDVHAVGIRRRNQNKNHIVQDRQRVCVVGVRQVVSELRGHLRSDYLRRVNRARNDYDSFAVAN